MIVKDIRIKLIRFICFGFGKFEVSFQGFWKAIDSNSPDRIFIDMDHDHQLSLLFSGSLSMLKLL